MSMPENDGHKGDMGSENTMVPKKQEMKKMVTAILPYIAIRVFGVALLSFEHEITGAWKTTTSRFLLTKYCVVLRV